ncbi:hypothetical protein M885DRAFT_590243, partial [Pelagophyceae sp. CCMP2097]
MAAIIAAAVQTAMAGLAAGQTGPAEPAASQAGASGGVPNGATAPDAAATLPPTEPVRPATPPRRQRAEQQSRTPKSGASFLNYNTLVDKEYRVARLEFQRSSHFGDTRNTLGGDVQCSCSAGKQFRKNKSCSCFKNGASCTNKCHGGRGSSTAKYCNTTNPDDPRLLLPGAFASRPCDAGALGPVARKELLFKAVNSLQGGMEVCVWVVGSDVLNGGPGDWVLGKLTHEAGNPRHFVVNY